MDMPVDTYLINTLMNRGTLKVHSKAETTSSMYVVYT